MSVCSTTARNYSSAAAKFFYLEGDSFFPILLYIGQNCKSTLQYIIVQVCGDEWYFSEEERRKRKLSVCVESNKKFWEYSQAEANFISTVVVSLTDDMIGFQAQHNFSHCTPRTGWHSRSCCCSFSLPRHPREVKSTNEICILCTTQYWRGGRTTQPKIPSIFQ